jgi:hypothetical protein
MDRGSTPTLRQAQGRLSRAKNAREMGHTFESGRIDGAAADNSWPLDGRMRPSPH